MSERETWWMLGVTMAATAPDGWARALAIVLALAAMLWVAAERRPGPHFVVRLPELSRQH
jgi:hypothetical protein